MFKAIFISSIILNIGLLLGRLSGFIRQAFVATAYGDSGEADTVIFMLTVPDLLVNILMGGALGAVLIPAFAKKPGQAKQMLYQSTVIFGAIALALAGIFFWQSDQLVMLLAPGFEGKQLEDASAAFGYVALLIPLTVMAGGTTAFLQYKNKFAIPSLGTLIVNASIIVGLYIVYTGKGTIVILAGFVILGGLLRLLSQVIASKPTWNSISSMKPALLDCEFFVHYGRAMLTGSILILFPVVAKAIGSLSGEGAYATMDYALKLIQFPLVIAITFVVTVYFPRLSTAHEDNKEQFSVLLLQGAQVIVALSVVASISLYFVSGKYASLVYLHGNMEETSVTNIGSITAIGLLSLPFQGLVALLMTSKFAQKNTTTPLVINTAGLGCFYVLAVSNLFGEGLAPLMWALVVSYGVIGILYLGFFQYNRKPLVFLLFNPSYVASLSVTAVFLVFAGTTIQQVGFTSTVAVSLAFVSALFALILMVFLYPKTRKPLLARLRSK